MAIPDRFLIGSDTWSNSQWAKYQDLIETHRAWLRHLPRAVAEQITYRNAERLFGRKVTTELLGRPDSAALRGGLP